MRREEVKRGIFYGRIWGNNSRIKKMLVMEFGKCFWCDLKVKIYPQINGTNLPPDNATLDHLKSRIAGRRKGENTPKVLSCRKCNEDRARDEIRERNSA